MSKFVVAAMVLMAVGISLLLCFQAAKPENQIQHNAGIAPDELGNVLGINYWKVPRCRGRRACGSPTVLCLPRFWATASPGR